MSRVVERSEIQRRLDEHPGEVLPTMLYTLFKLDEIASQVPHVRNESADTVKELREAGWLQ